MRKYLQMKASLLAAIVAGAAMAGPACKSNPARPDALSLAQTVERALTGEGARPWEADRPLTWDEYKGRPPASTGQEAASTAYDLVHGMRCTGQRFEFVVIAAFQPERSWVLSTVAADPAASLRMLQHERTHFNLTEVHARRMRRYFSQLLHPCTRPQTELQSALTHFIEQEAEAQGRYDRETSYGRMTDRQEAWNSDVARLLASFAAYER
jgi:hypothetical protein